MKQKSKVDCTSPIETLRVENKGAETREERCNYHFLLPHEITPIPRERKQRESLEKHPTTVCIFFPSLACT